MTTQEYIKRQHTKITQLKSGVVVGIAAQDTHVKMTERIFENGSNSTGGEIGEYNSTDPIYVNPNNSPKKFPKKGKDGKTKFKNGKEHKTGYFESYKDYRSKVGRNSDSVNLNLFGNLQNDFGKGVVKLDSEVYASTVTQESNKNKVKGIESKYGDVFKLSNEEKDNFREVLEFESLKILR